MAFSRKGKEEAAKAAESGVSADLEATSLYSEDPLEALLDEQSDEEFGDLELKERAGKPVKLAEWTAQDFSSIYLRFRPHLERHARRFLSNPSQVDEVVQDAFLYLMVSLPELDSEIGVLRFLKWKTRLLALDVIRASGRAYINSIDDVQEPASDDPEISSSLEQQDDAAVVKLALSKLNPRHREVLIASMYEEKSTEQIAAQVGLSENATRQLIFRARAAFKKALIGDVDTTGMSAAAILSVAARKAASEGKKVGAAALTLIALVVMSLTVFPSLNRAPSDQMAEAPANTGSSELTGQSSESPESSGSASATNAPNSPSSGAESDPGSSIGSSLDSSPSTNTSEESAANYANPKSTQDQAEKALSGPVLGSIMNSDVKSKVFVLDKNFTAVGDNGLTARFTFNPTTDEVFTNVLVEVSLKGLVFDFQPTKPMLIQGKSVSGDQVFMFTGQAPFLFDEYGQTWTETEAKNATFKLEVIMESNGIDVKEVKLALYRAN
jgi:RNA polymerase sigma-70 factor (ECF subfamily)